MKRLPAIAAACAAWICLDPSTARAQLLGDPAGARSRLRQLGAELQLFYNQFLGWKPQGGAEPSSTFGHSASYDFFAWVDGEELLGWPGLEALLHLKGQYDRSVNADVGALSDPIDDADFDEPIYVDELWVQQSLCRERLRARAGFSEQQTMFDRNEYANSEDKQFLSTFLDNNAVVPLPDGLAASLWLGVTDSLELAVGVADADNEPRRAGFDTAFDGASSLTGYLELALHAGIPAAGGALPGHYRLGMFVDGRRLASFGTDRSSRGHLGAWASFDQLVFREPGTGADGAGSPRGLGLFARFGYADPEVNRIAWFGSAGLEYRGLLPPRPEDVLGLAGYGAFGSDRYRKRVDPRFEREAGIEVYYRVALLPWLALTPDFQYVIDPGATGSADDAVVAVLRLRVSF